MITQIKYMQLYYYNLYVLLQVFENLNNNIPNINFICFIILSNYLFISKI